MSIPTGFQGLRMSVERGEKISNKSHMQFPVCGDANANQMGDLEYSTGSIPPLVSQSETHEKIVFWSSEQPFQPCQEIHTFLGKSDDVYDDEDEGVSLRDGRDEGPMSISSSSSASSASARVKRNSDDSNKVDVRRGRQEHKRAASHSTEDFDTSIPVERDEVRMGRATERDRQKSKSETNVFVSSLSTVSLSGSLSSALDTGGETRITLPVYKSHLYSSGASNTTSVQTRRGSAPMDANNKNSPPYHPQEKLPQYSRGSSQDSGLGQRRKAGFEERVLPPRRQQLVRPMCQTEMGRARSLPESSSHQVDPGQTNEEYLGNRKFTRSSLREPSDFSHLYTSSGMLRQPGQAAQRDMSPAERPLTSASRPNPSPRPQTQLTYRRNCSSPNRVATPPHSPLRTPQESPRRQPSMFIIPRNVPGVARHGTPPGPNAAVSTQGYGNSSLRAPVKTSISTTGTARPAPNSRQSPPKDSSPSPKHTQKPKGVRPKIITYVRKNPQFKPQVADGPYQVSSLPSRLSTYSNNQTMSKDPPKEKADVNPREAPVLSASNLLYEKYRQEMQTGAYPQTGGLNRGARPNTVPPAHAPHGHSHTAPPKLGSKSDNFYGTPPELGRPGSFKGSPADDPLQARTVAQVGGGSSSLLRSSRGLRLGLGAVTRTGPGPAKSRGLAQRPATVMSQPVQPISPTEKSHEADDQVFTQNAPVPSVAEACSAAARPVLPKASQSPSQSGLRPPGYSSSRLPPGRLAAFGFVRSSSVSSASSAQSGESGAGDPPRTIHRLSVSEEPPLHRVTTGPSSAAEPQRGPPSRSLQPPSTPALPRRYLPAQPRSSPGVGRKEFQRSSEVTRSLPSSPKRLAVVPPKPQSPVPGDQRPSAVVRGSAPPGSPRRVAPLKPLPQEEIIQREKEEAQQKERERQEDERQRNEQREEVQRLQGRCEQQETQLRALRDELRRMSLGLEAFIITTQHYCLKNKTSEENEKKLSQEINNIKEEIASHSQRWERLHREKTALEVAFERELQELQTQQETELAAVEAGLRKCHSAETENLTAEHRSEMEELRTQQQEQMEEMTVGHQAAIQELRDMHNITMATLHEEHARTMRDLRKAHEQQKILLEEHFEKLRLSLQDQVDTLTFQNQSLRDKAKRFEEALRRSTDEQIVDALAPYQHIEQDLKSLKEVVEMKNKQIHQQEKKITDLEKVAQKNVYLEEKIQVLQQQNEDLKARIDMNLALSRQLSEDNANLQESVDKESTEKKRLSRNNEELLWRLHSPLMSPSSSPLHRSFSTSPVPSSPFLCSSPLTACESPTHCLGCPQQAQYFSPTHKAATNQNYSPGPGTPTHKAVINRNLSPGPATPTHRAVTNQNYSPGPATPTHRASVNLH